MAFSVPKLFIFAAVLACAFVANAGRFFVKHHILAHTVAYLFMLLPGPLSRRQVGNAQCNIDRLKFVVNLQETSDQINKLATELAYVCSLCHFDYHLIAMAQKHEFLFYRRQRSVWHRRCLPGD